MNFQNNKQRIDTVYINHHAIRLASLERAESVLRQEIRTAQADLSRFVEFDSELAHSALSQLKREIQALREQLGETDRAIELNTAQLAKARKAAELGFFGRVYKTTEQSVAILQVDYA